jgi:hypothetical protein
VIKRYVVEICFSWKSIYSVILLWIICEKENEYTSILHITLCFRRIFPYKNTLYQTPQHRHIKNHITYIISESILSNFFEGKSCDFVSISLLFYLLSHLFPPEFIHIFTLSFSFFPKITPKLGEPKLENNFLYYIYFAHSIPIFLNLFCSYCHTYITELSNKIINISI